MKRLIFISAMIALYSIHINAQQFTVDGGFSGKQPIYEKADAGSGIDTIAILNGLDGASISFTTNSGNPLSWFKYTVNSNARTSLTSSQIGNKSTLTETISSDTGFGVVDGTKTYYIWIIDYQQYEVKSIEVSAVNTNECDELNLTLTAAKFNMKYTGATAPLLYSIAKYEVPIEYSSMKADETNKVFVTELKSITKAVSHNITLIGEDELPYKNTSFKVGNDRFAAQWGLVKNIVSAEYVAVAVLAKADAKHTVRDAENELEKEKAPLGGSAPVEIAFTGYANEPTTTYYTWDFASDNKFTDQSTIASVPDKNARYTFSQAGKYYARLTVANSKNSCIDSTQVFEIDITESVLNVPNVFSPNGDGKNDIFLVAYKSIVKFNGWIFNRYGNQVFSWSDPSKGWDGKVGGKYVIPGVYFYVIEAEGSEGKQWKLKGDINVFSKQ